MKMFSFPTGGSFGRGDSWEGIFDFELTDEEMQKMADLHTGQRYENW